MVLISLNIIHFYRLLGMESLLFLLFCFLTLSQNGSFQEGTAGKVVSHLETSIVSVGSGIRLPLLSVSSKCYGKIRKALIFS